METPHHVDLGRIVEIGNGCADGASGVLPAARGVRGEVAQPGMPGPETSDVRHETLSETLARLLVRIGGKLVEFACHRLRLLMEQVRVGVHPTGAEDRTEDGDERAVGISKLCCLVHGGESEGKIGRGRSAHEGADLGAGVLQAFDGGGQLLVESP